MHEVALEISRTSTKYRSELRAAYGNLVRWVATTRWSNQLWLEDPQLASQVVCEHVQFLKETGRPLGDARHCILSVQTIHRALKGKLSRPWDCVKSWQLEKPLRSRVPLPSLLMTGFFLFSVATALTCTSDYDIHSHFSFAILCRLGHHCLLRPNEIIKLCVGDLRLPRSSFEPEVCIVRLRDPKNRASLGRFQFAMVRDTGLVAWLRWYIHGCPSEMRLWPGKQPRFSKMFRQVRDRLGWERLPLTPGSLRPGGATEQFMAGASVSVLKYAGRWRVESSLEVYIQEAMSHLCVCELDDREFDSLSSLIRAGSAQWIQPPSHPATHFFDRRAQWRGIHSFRSQRTRKIQTLPLGC